MQMLRKTLSAPVFVLTGLTVVLPGLSEAKEECGSFVDNQQLEAELDQLESSIKAMETVKFNPANDLFASANPCSKQLLSRSNVARIHRIEAIAAFGDRKMGMLRAHSRAAHLL